MADPLFDKVWKMSPTNSIYSTAYKPRSETRLYEERPNGYKLTVSGEDDSGPYQWHYEAYYDGMPHPVHGRRDADAITIFRLDDYNTVGFFTKNNTPAGPYKRKVDLERKTLTVEMAGRGSNGQPFYDVIEYSL